METNTTQRKKRRVFYKRPVFLLALLAALVVAVGLTYYAVTDKSPISAIDQTSEKENEGKIEIITQPEKAVVLVDGKERKGRTPMSFSLPVGQHEITLKLSGYDEQKVPIQVTEENPASIVHTFTKQGQIVIDEKPENFKTYTNDANKYRIKHPKRWKVETESPEAVDFYDTGRAQAEEQGSLFGIERALAHGEEQASLSILVVPNPGNLGPKEWYQSRPEFSQEDQSQIKTRDVTVNGRPAFQYETPYGFVPYLITVVTGNGKAYLLQQIQNSPERATYDQVIQTFTLF